MIQTLSYYSSVFYKDFVNYTSEKLESCGAHFGSIFFLIYIGKHPDCTPSEVTKNLKMDWGHCQRSLTKLEKDGLIIRKKEGRSYQIELTKKGGKAYQVSHDVFYEWDEAHLGALTKQEREEFFMLLNKIKIRRYKI